jgi:BolA protein
MSQSTSQKIEKILREKIKPLHLQIKDESAQHAGHAGAASGGGHYNVIIVSDLFEGMSLIEQHRRVKEVLRELFKHEIHALKLKTFAPSNWK